MIPERRRSAALVLGRMRRRVVVFDADDPAHAASERVHGFFGHERTPPLELRRLGREQLRPYSTVTVRVGAVEGWKQRPGGLPCRPLGRRPRSVSCCCAPAHGTSCRRWWAHPISGLAASTTALIVTAGRCATGRRRLWHGRGWVRVADGSSDERVGLFLMPNIVRSRLHAKLG